MRRSLCTAAILLVVAPAARSLAAQPEVPAAVGATPTMARETIAPADSLPRSECTYEACALRQEPGFWGPRLVRGATATRVPNVSVWRGREFVQLFAGSDSAEAYARRHVHAQRAGTLLSLTGAILVGIGAATQDDPILNYYCMAGGYIGLASIPFQIRAQRSLSRAVWWYNASLPHSPTAPRAP